jgi:quercetin dioxygenase-like cupin family protein
MASIRHVLSENSIPGDAANKWKQGQAEQNGAIMFWGQRNGRKTIMPVMSGFGALEKLPWERVNDKIERRVLAGKHGMIVWWKVKAGAHAGAHQHPHEQIVWMLKGKMDFRIGNERRSMIAGDVAVIPGDTEHEGFFSEDTEVVDIFAPPREDFLAGGTPSYMRAP